MTLHEAIATGRPYFYPDSITYQPGVDYTFTFKEVCRTDWQIKEAEVTITATQFWEAFKKAYDQRNPGKRTRQLSGISIDVDVFKLLAEELGLDLRGVRE